MQNLAKIEPVDYLIIGHITQDVTTNGLKLGGTASFASLTARAFGVRVGIVTACAPDLILDQLTGISISRKNSVHTSTFRNTYTIEGRIQHILHVADGIELEDVPPAWRDTPIVHLGPLTGEISPTLARSFPNSLTGITPQGWMRGWNSEGVVSYKAWDEAEKVLPYVQAAVMSIEDVRGNEDVIASYAAQVPILIVTEGAAGSRVYWNGDVRYFRPPQEDEVDPVGAGDIFSAVFFIKLFQTRDPWEAVKVATLVAANSVTRVGLLGVPTPEEVTRFTTQIIEHPIK